MRLSFCVIFIFIFTIARSSGPADSTTTKLKAYATVSLNSNGIASIPAFSLDKPAVIASASLVKGRFSYDPTLAYGFDLRPWYIDNWLHYKIVARPSFDLVAGFNISSFFTQSKPADEIVLKGERYFAFALTGVYRISSVSSLACAYWNDRGQEKESLKGHFLSVTGERTDIAVGKSILLSGSVMLFYINYTGKNDGLFVSPRLAASLRKSPFSIFFQATQALTSNISPFPEFRWNVGVSYTL
jgi:hypothetical protein